MDYPKWKYSQDQALIVHGEDEEAALSGAWFDSPADVPAPVVVMTDDEQMMADAKAEKAALLNKAGVLGVTIDARWGLAKIKEALAGAVA